MNPQVAEHGRSHKGAFMYYMHDKNATSRDRIAWAETYNTITEDVDKAWKVMAYTAMNSSRLKEAEGRSRVGRKDSKPVMAYSLSWHPNEAPDCDHMREVAIKSIKALGLEEHEAYIVAHRDTPHRHVHVIINRVHPRTGLIAGDSNTWRKLSDFARIYCKEHNMEYAPKREENHRKRQEGKQSKYRDPKIQAAWDASDSGQSFVTALQESGYVLAQGRKRLVVIDPYGKAHNPVRHIEGIKAKDFYARMADIDPAALEDADTVAKTVQAKHEAKKRELAATKAEDRSKDSGASREETAPPDEEADRRAEEITKALNNLQDRHIEEQADLFRYYNQRIHHEEKTLGEFYDLDGQRGRIKALQGKIDKASWLRRFLRLTRKDQRRLDVLKTNMADARKRYDERLDTLHGEFAREREKLRQSYEKRYAHLSNGLSVSQEQQLLKSRQKQKTRGPKCEHTRSRGRGRGVPGNNRS